MRLASSLLVLTVFPLALAAAQSPTPEKASIEGSVVKATTGEPLRRAAVTIQRIDLPSMQFAALTNSGGRFNFANLDPGRYNLWADRPGFIGKPYQPEGAGRANGWLELRPGQRLRDIVMKLTSAAVLSGTVLDEEGEPINGATVQVYSESYMGSRRQWNAINGSSTNDLGEFRISGLPPGRYYLCAVYSNGYRGPGQGEETYAPVWYPGGSFSESATPLELHAGDVLNGISFTLSPTHAVCIRGLVTDLIKNKRNQGRSIMLVPQYAEARAMVQQNYGVTVNEKGEFEIHNVAPGSYTLMATTYTGGGKPLTAREPVEVGDADVDNVVLITGPGVEINGRVSVEGTPDQKAAGTQVGLEALEPMFAGTQPVPVGETGKFVLKDVPEGIYHVNVWGMPANYYLKAARLSGDDVLNSDITIRRRALSDYLEILLSSAGGQVSGAVSKHQDPWPGATVTLVPDARGRAQTRLYRMINADEHGNFSLEGIPPGDYYLYAWQKIDDGAYFNPQVLQLHERQAQSVHVAEGGRTQARLEVIPPDDTAP